MESRVRVHGWSHTWFMRGSTTTWEVKKNRGKKTNAWDEESVEFMKRREKELRQTREDKKVAKRHAKIEGLLRGRCKGRERVDLVVVVTVRRWQRLAVLSKRRGRKASYILGKYRLYVRAIVTTSQSLAKSLKSSRTKTTSRKM